MADSIKIGNLDISAFKVGSADCKIYLGNTLLYPQNVSYKLIAQYSDTTEYKVVCNSSTSLTQTEVTSHTTPISAMTSAVVSDCVTEIGLNAFSGASSLTSLTLSDDITRFNNQSFIRLNSLRSFTFPSSLTYLGGSTFRFSGIRKFNNRIPSGVTALPSGCFADMYSLSAITIPSGIVSGSTNVFLRDSGLTEVHFERTTPPALGADAFKGCTALIKIYIPSCDCYDAYAADSQFSGLTNLIYSEADTKCKQEAMPYAMYRVSRNGSGVTIACNSSSSNTITTANTRTGITVASLTSSTATQTPVEIKFGDCCKVISTGACSGWTYLTSVTISDSVTGLSGNFQFYNCRRVKEFNVGNGLKSIGSTQFATNLGRVYSAQSASNWVDVDFSRTTNLTIGGGSVFAYAYINNLKFGSGVQINGNSCFQYANINSIKFNGSGSIGGASTSSNGKFTNAVIGSIDFGGVTSIGSCAFFKTSGYNSKITIPSSVTSIGDYIFNDTSGLTEVELDYSASDVGSSVFAYATSLKKVTFGTHPTKIGGTMFNNCTSLSAITIPNNITFIGGQAFNGCSGMTSCELPNNLTEIKNSTFKGCTSLTSITIPSSVTTIQGSAFSGCVMQYAEILATTPPSLPGTYTFTSTYPIYVPDASVDAYKSAGGDWSQYTSRIKPLSQKP